MEKSKVDVQRNDNKAEFSLRFFTVLLVQGIIFLLVSFNLNLKIDIEDLSNGSIQVYYWDSSNAEPALTEYDSSTQWKSIDRDITSVSFGNIPIATDKLRIDIDGTPRLSISNLSLSFKNVPFFTLNAETLAEMIDISYNIEYTLENGILKFTRLGPDAYIQLKIFRFFGAPFWVLFLCITMSISVIAEKLLYPFLSKKDIYYRELPLIATSIVMSIIIELINKNYWFISRPYRIINVLFLYVICKIIYLICNRLTLSIFLFCVSSTLFGCANYFVLQFRGKPLLPPDLLATRTALDVASGYDFSFTAPMIAGIILTALLPYLVRHLKGANCKGLLQRCRYIVCNLCFIAFMTIAVLNSSIFSRMKTEYWNSDIQYLYKIQGSVASFIKYGMSIKVKEPYGYSKSKLMDIRESVEPEHVNKKTDPIAENVIMVMNESFSDLKVLGNAYDEEVLPFLNSLNDNVIKGNLYVSVRGGGTCNTEYEALTGNSLIFLPVGTYPFQLYIRKQENSIVNYFNKNGYSTVGLHLENPQNWNRKNVYPKLGFENFFSINDFTNLDYVRNRVTDSSNYECLRSILDTSDTEKNFIFNVTIQNHGGYSESNDLDNIVDLSKYGEYKDASTFLSLIKLSDNAFEELIDYFSEIETPTMVIMFGDHQPSLSGKTESWLMNGGKDRDIMKEYITPFVIWTNYDIEERYIDKISANFLPTLIMETGNLNMPPYYCFLAEVYKQFPVLTTQGIIDANGVYYSKWEDIPNNTILQNYEYLQYNNMFDENKLKDFFD